MFCRRFGEEAEDDAVSGEVGEVGLSADDGSGEALSAAVVAAPADDLARLRWFNASSFATASASEAQVFAFRSNFFAATLLRPHAVSLDSLNFATCA